MLNLSFFFELNKFYQIHVQFSIKILSKFVLDQKFWGKNEFGGLLVLTEVDSSLSFACIVL